MLNLLSIDADECISLYNFLYAQPPPPPSDRKYEEKNNSVPNQINILSTWISICRSGSINSIQWSGSINSVQWSGSIIAIQWSGSINSVQWFGSINSIQWSRSINSVQWSGSATPNLTYPAQWSRWWWALAAIMASLLDGSGLLDTLCTTATSKFIELELKS